MLHFRSKNLTRPSEGRTIQLKSLLIATGILVAAVTSPTTASANHQSYCYNGQCLHIDGEQHMIDALRAMDVLYAAPCVRTRGQASVPVQRELGRAIGEVESVDARLLLIKSQGLVGRFVGTGNGIFLDSAAQMVTQAIAAEQLAYQRLQANERFTSNRPPISHEREIARPYGYGYGSNFGFNAYRAPSFGYGYGTGHQAYSQFGSGYGFAPGYGSGFGNFGPGCNPYPSSGFSLRIGR